MAASEAGKTAKSFEDRNRSRREGPLFHPTWAVWAAAILVMSALVALLQPSNPDELKQKGHVSFAERVLWPMLYPIEVNPELRLPALPDDLTAIAMSDDGSHGMAVGVGGLVMVTADRGVTWQQSESGTGATLYGVSCSVDCSTAWIVGDGGTMLLSTDSGLHWVRRDVPVPPGVSLRAVQLLRDGRHIWAAGDGGVIIASSDGGSSWLLQDSNNGPRLLSVDFLEDAKHGWAAGYSGALFATVDGGRSWVLQDASRYTLFSVKFATDGMHGVAVGAMDTVLQTRDGGAHWIPLRHPGDGDERHQDYRYYGAYLSADGQKIWLGRSDGSLFGSADAGRTWSLQSVHATPALYDMRFDSGGQSGWAIAGESTILSTDDGGLTWTRRASGAPTTINGVYFETKGLKGWAVTGDGQIIATQDGGQDWVQQRESGFGLTALNSVTFADDKRGWAVGDGGTIVATQDSGTTWKPQAAGTVSQLNSVRFRADGLQGFAVGENGTVLRTLDGGQTWRLNGYQLLNSPVLQAVFFDRSGNEWIVGSDGAIFASVDSGQTWEPVGSPTNHYLNDGWMDPRSQRGWIVGAAGTMLATIDGGKSWILQKSATQADLESVQFDVGGVHGRVAASDGSVLVTDDGGASWRVADTKFGSSRLDVAVVSNTLWAFGYPPALLSSTDNGQTWNSQPWPLSYSRYPAPWFWLNLIFCFYCAFRAVRPGQAISADGVEAIGLSDAPISRANDDRLQFAPLARGISRFLRNRNTEAPLTLAITGDWGSGKSSLMKLVCSDLQRFGSRPVWFNAWHHQNEEDLLAALLGKIRETALPPPGTADDLLFRFRLLASRARGHMLATGLAFAGLATLCALLAFYGFAPWERFWRVVACFPSLLQEKSCQVFFPNHLFDSVAASGKVVGELIGAVVSLRFLIGGLSAFKVDPAILMSKVARTFRLKDAGLQTSFRTRFAQEFDEVTSALPWTLVIVIDDLDRCRPETVITVMEAINFLVTSGKCFVVFGMASQRVQALLAVALERIASELVDLDAGIDEVPKATREQAERDRRQKYAREYLDKLVNIEIAVPDRGDIAARLLASGDSERRLTWNPRVFGQAFDYWPSWIMAALIVFGVVSAFTYFKASPVAPVAQALPMPAVTIAASTTAVLAVAASASPPKDSAPSSQQAPVRSSSAPHYRPTVQFSPTHPTALIVVGLAGLLSLSLAFGLFMSRLREAVRQVEDSDEFQSSLEVWLPVVQLRRRTPRGIKRFGNRLRYLAMLQQRTELDETLRDAIRRRGREILRQLSRPMARIIARRPESELAEAAPRGPQGNLIRESVLVALASLYEVAGADWQDYLIFQLKGEPALIQVVQSAIQRLDPSARAAWPPSAQDIGQFEQLLKGVRLAGEPTIRSSA